MTKSELIKAVAAGTGTTKQDVSDVLNTAFAIISDELADGNKVALQGFGSFVVKEHCAHTGHNFNTGETMSLPPNRTVQFVPSKHLRAAVRYSSGVAEPGNADKDK